MIFARAILLYFGLAVGVICTALHLAVLGLHRWMGSQAPVAIQAQARAAHVAQISER
ncbi:MAG TPA: hypothetical protein VGN32_01740 [Ktedonobacterales bacterium]|jgi:hypothetical protein|nr:hypothetical protein [Ktedonobacterales bacterium]